MIDAERCFARYLLIQLGESSPITEMRLSDHERYENQPNHDSTNAIARDRSSDFLQGNPKAAASLAPTETTLSFCTQAHLL